MTRSLVAVAALTSVFLLGLAPTAAHAAKPSLVEKCEDTNTKIKGGVQSECDY